VELQIGVSELPVGMPAWAEKWRLFALILRALRTNLDPDMSPAPATSTFQSTRWAFVLRSRGNSPKALGGLCEVSWAPVFRFLRSEGRFNDDSRELAQEFFPVCSRVVVSMDAIRRRVAFAPTCSVR
jgi:hypothetical protein